MRRAEALLSTCHRIDGRGYKGYQDLKGLWQFEDAVLDIVRVQGDPFAEPSKVALRLPMPQALTKVAPFVAAADFLNRKLCAQFKKISRRIGTGGGGAVLIQSPSQVILSRSSVTQDDDALMLRFRVGLPAAGRRVLGRDAGELLLGVVESILQCIEDLAIEDLRTHCGCYQRQKSLRQQLRERNLVAFIGNGAVLPRRSGDSDLPLVDAVPFESPPSLAVELTHEGQTVVGMGVPKGVTLIVGGGFHGKSTLLRAIGQGMYNHIPTDGRDMVVADPDALSIRAEDGRSVCQVDIRNFMGELPDGTDTARFSTNNASGSTSQASCIVEAVEGGASLLLIDEDTSATNFMVRDQTMRALISDDKEPIRPFIDKVQALSQSSVSTIICVGGLGDFLGVADTVIAMNRYRPEDLGDRARTLSSRRETAGVWRQPRSRNLRFKADSSSKKRRKMKVYGLHRLQIDRLETDLSGLQQLAESAQIRAAALSTFDVRGPEKNLEARQWAEKFCADLKDSGFAGWVDRSWELSELRAIDLLSVINRLRNLEATQVS